MTFDTDAEKQVPLEPAPRPRYIKFLTGVSYVLYAVFIVGVAFDALAARPRACHPGVADSVDVDTYPAHTQASRALNSVYNDQEEFSQLTIDQRKIIKRTEEARTIEKTASVPINSVYEDTDFI